MADHTKNLPRNAGGMLTLNESAANGWTNRFDIDFSHVKDAELTTDGDTLTLKLCQLPEGVAVKAAALRVVEAFATDGTLTASLGSSASPAAVIAAQDIKTAGIKAPVAGFVPATAAGALPADLVIRFATQASTGAISDISAGRLAVFLQLVRC